RQIVNHVIGFSPFIAKELVERTELGSQAEYTKQFRIMQTEINNHQYTPAIYENKREDFHVLPISCVHVENQFSIILELFDNYFASKSEREREAQRVRD